MEGKDFFVTELDNSLLKGEIDFTVHSMKDLSLERPTEISLGAIPTRENPRDVVLAYSCRIGAGAGARFAARYKGAGRACERRR